MQNSTYISAITRIRHESRLMGTNRSTAQSLVVESGSEEGVVGEGRRGSQDTHGQMVSQSYRYTHTRNTPLKQAAGTLAYVRLYEARAQGTLHRRFVVGQKRTGDTG